MRKKKLWGLVGLFCLGAVGYSLLELLWRGRTHWTMGVTGGLCLSTLYGISRRVKEWGLLRKCALGSAVITGYELAVGWLVNLKLHWNVWDYSQMPFHFKGQVCLGYSCLWFLLCIPLFALCSVLGRRR